MDFQLVHILNLMNDTFLQNNHDDSYHVNKQNDD